MAAARSPSRLRPRRAGYAALAVVIREDGMVYAGRLGAALGPLKGSYAEVTAGVPSRRAAAAVLGTAAVGPAGLLFGLSKKAKATAFIVFANGAIHEHKLDGNMMVRRGQEDAIKYNARARGAGG